MRIICDNTDQEMEDRDRSLVAVSTVGGELPVRHYYRHEYDEVDGCILSRRQDSQVKYTTQVRVTQLLE